MSRRRQFADLMLAEADDFNKIGEFAQADDDAIITDGLTAQRKFSGFNVSILPGSTSVSVSAGRYYNGGMYRQDEPTELVFGTLLPLVQKRIGAVTVWGQEVDADPEQRSVAVDADDEIGEPQLLQMTRARIARVELLLGAESGNPAMPAIPANSIVVATFVIGTAGVEGSVVPYTDNLLRSAQANAEDIGKLNAFRSRIEPTVTGLISDLAALTERTSDRASRQDLSRGLIDIARLKDLAGLPDDYAQYAADFFNDDDETDTVYSTSTAKIDNGLLFPDAASSKFALQLFNANDPAAKKSSSGQVLPAYNDVVAIAGPATIGDISMSQYEVKTHTIKTHTVYRTVTKFGWTWNWSRRWHSYRYLTTASWLFLNVLHPTYWGFWLRKPVKTYYPITEEIAEEVTTVEATTANYNGILTAETFRAPRAMWFTGVNLLLTSLDVSGDIHAFLTETDLGQPHLARTLSRVTIAAADLKKAPVKTPVMFNPTLLDSGKLYGIVLITQGNHRIATVHPDDWRDGTYFAGTDGEYFIGDLTRDIYLEILGAQFVRPRSEIVLQTADLVGGINDIKIETEQIVPPGTELSYEVNVAGTWKPLASLESLPGGTNTAPLRAVCVGSQDLMPAFYTGADRVTVSRPALAMSHQSDTITLAAPAQDFRLEYVVNKWDADDHTLTPTLREGANTHTPDVTVAAVPNDADGEDVLVAFTFNLDAPISSFKIRTDATRDASAAPPAILERRYVALQ